MAGPPNSNVPGRPRLGLSAEAERADWDAQTRGARRQKDAIDAQSNQIKGLQAQVGAMQNASIRTVYPFHSATMSASYDYMPNEHLGNSHTLVRTHGFTQVRLVIEEGGSTGGTYIVEYSFTGSSVWSDICSSPLTMTTTRAVTPADDMPQSTAWADLAAAALNADIAIRVRATTSNTITTDPVNAAVQFMAPSYNVAVMS